MGNAQAINIAPCCCESRTDVAGMQNSVLLAPKVPPKEEVNLYGVGLVFRTTRDGKMVVSSFVKDSSAYECGLVRDGGTDLMCAFSINRAFPFLDPCLCHMHVTYTCTSLHGIAALCRFPHHVTVPLVQIVPRYQSPVYHTYKFSHAKAS